MKQDVTDNQRPGTSGKREEVVMRDQQYRSKDGVAKALAPQNPKDRDRQSFLGRSRSLMKSVFTQQRGGAVMKTRTCFAVMVMMWAVSFGTVVSFAQTDLTFYQNNPVITAGSWDKGGPVWFPSVVLKDTAYHMFYTGLSSPSAIGWANSQNGLSFIKHASAPVFEADGTGFDAYSVMAPSVVVEGDSLVLFYGGACSPFEAICIMPRAIGRATAQSPAGPWQRSREPVLTTGSADEWDGAFVYPNSVIATDTGYLMYYTGGRSKTESQIGAAISSDGIHWKKEDEPVLRPGEGGSWDAGSVSRAAVVKTAQGWCMYYTGTGEDDRQRIGCATSDNGLLWVKHPDTPILSPDQSWAAENLFAGSAVLNGEATAHLLYFAGSGSDNLQIGVATEPLNRADCNEDGRVNIMDAYWLYLATLRDVPVSAWHCDCNGDGREELRLLDVVCIVNNVILGQECPVSEGKVELSPSEMMEFEEALKPYVPAEDLARLMALIKPEGRVPVAYSLAQNHPNPFNPVTSIEYTLAEASKVKVEVYNVLGQVVAVLVDSHKQAGAHHVRWDASDMASGYYFYRLTAGATSPDKSGTEFTATKRMALMK